ncbi:MAG: hypothetical protein DRP45_05280 [Candidatus Zixiibacteriota bacterium]|nr:MAG: hypothetical protein DRP45_05280 [candidate division Zixibacteria bacterium]
MIAKIASPGDTGFQGLVEQAGIELNRAERYHVFVSMSVIDFSQLADSAGTRIPEFTERINSIVSKVIRGCDYATLLDNGSLALLFPETPRQGAEVATRRISELARKELRDVIGEVTDTVPVEIASYPDTAGAKTMAAFLKEVAHR